ncbi:hypothetical protein LPJ53_006126 [Coemansia erecta]|uniref:Uncharacterized protein n=1 Tax=Coemansia erecta TaxID=147472 RepID=A0A9W7XV66_9FUNG|nr:hypothetical protein LPJ53_006126 [Coemansia erecta]
MPSVLISDTYPTREQLADDSKTLVVDSKPKELHVSAAVCPFSQASGTSRPVLRYSATQEDERMRQALKVLRTARSDFRTGDYAQSFNWGEISSEYRRLAGGGSHGHLQSRADDLVWYAVVFRSKRRADCNNVDLFMADKNAYEEAYAHTNGALLVYWYSDLDDNNDCLATCVWTSRVIARSVNSLPAHREAAGLAAGAYVHYHIDRYRIQWLAGEERLSLAPW